MKFIAICFASMILFFSSAEIAQAQSSAEKVIANYISKDAEEQDADEYAEGRKIVYGDVNGDRVADAVVLYTLEGMGGGNNFAQTLAVFIKEKGTFRFAASAGVGSKLGDKTSTLKSINGGRIRLETESCAEPPQGICRNPRKGIMTVTFRGGKLFAFGRRLP